MKKQSILFAALLVASLTLFAQQAIPLDTAHWNIRANAYLFERMLGSEAIYLQGGSITYKGEDFMNGSIEFDILLKEEQAFPGLYFRIQDNGDAEHFYIRPHLSGKPDANQAAPVTRGVTPWQLCFGPKYSFPYTYQYDYWTHVKILVHGSRAQVFLDHSNKAQLSWKLFHPISRGKVSIQGGNRSGMHLANIVINHDIPDIEDFRPIERAPIEGLVQEWELSDKFEESSLDDPSMIPTIIKQRKWQNHVQVEEGTAANISRKVQLRDSNPGNTVFARITIHSEDEQMKLFHFGYSDRVVTILNGSPIYRGTNGYRSRDYRYLGTIGLFDSVYLPLKKGKNTLLMAVSEDFGGWLITGKFEDSDGIEIRKIK